ncbi:hypothetical protein BC628DRAFT_1326860 [Trametes gibbosa]|nr:hypothetical protein BC628DRAFT_1326860 [Trametes gibbosa]
MPSSLQSRDSPRTRHGRRRSPRGQLARSGSLLGTLKNIVTAPLAWFSSQPEFTDVAGKRRRNPGALDRDEDAYAEEDRPSAKRKRVDSPETISVPLRQPTRTTQGYLDVPEGLIAKKSTPRQRLTAPASHARSSSFAPSFSVPAMHNADLTRRTASPTISVSYSQPVAVQRTQSMDPPVYRPISLSRDASMEGGLPGSTSRDVTMSPSRRHTPFQLRARHSLTPQPSGQTFGPTPQHKGRDASEPPPLASLMSHPVFVKPPLELQHAHPEQPVTTLGSLAESKGHTSRSPLRQHSSLYFGARPGTITESSSHPYAGRVNAAEKALHDLDVYKTPLLPSRLRGSQTIPDMFKPKKTHAPVLMRLERERKPRLGTTDKPDAEEQPTVSKPYAGRGGMKKMLAKRKMEEEEERARERANAIETDLDEEVDGPHKPSYKQDESVDVQKRATDIVPPPSEPAFPIRPVGGREQSSLRVGRTHTSRNHIARPVAKGRNRFSAAFDEDEGDDSMLDETREQDTSEEPKKLPTLFESPKGFTFAPEKAPLIHDSGKAKEPPIAALPFSLTAPAAGPSTQSAQLFSLAGSSKAPASPPKPESTTAAAPGFTPTSLFPPVPSISLIPPSPVPPKPERSSSTAPSIPNFFATSSIFAKPGVGAALPAPVAAAEKAVTENVSKFKGTTAASATPFSFEPPGGSSLFGTDTQASTAPKEREAPHDEAPKPATSSLFGMGDSVTPFPFGGNVTPSVPSTTTSPLFGSAVAPKDISSPQPVSSLFSNPSATAEATKPTPAVSPPALAAAPSAPASSSFSFSAPAKSAEPPAPSTSPFNFGVPSASTPAAAPAASPALFSFGAPKPDSAKEPGLKPLFSASEPEKPSLFGAPASTPSPFGGHPPTNATSESAPKTPFTFGQPAQATTSAAPVIEAPKPLFASTSTGGSGGFSFGLPASAAAPATPAKSPFSFGAAPATPPVSTTENKPSFSFGAPSPAPQVSAPSSLFGGPSTGVHGADASKSFLFGASARPATPPRQEQEMRMEESPTRGGGMDMNGHEQPKPSGAFSFGAPSGSSGVSPFGQAAQSAAAPFSFVAKTEVKTESKPAAPFSFGTSTSSGGGFGFAQKAVESAQSPISPAPFGASTPFGQASNTPTVTAPAFSFGAQSAPSVGFGQGASSTPASPSTFGQPAPFGFGTPTSATAPSNPFAFGSQPASPATGNAGLPQPPGSSSGTSFTFGQPSSATTQSPATPFGAPPPASAGGVSFTIGSAAPQQQTAGVRTIKKLPNRRGGRQR